MPTSKDFQRVARTVKRELYSDRLGFKTYQCERFVTELNAGSGLHVGEDMWKKLESAFLQEGLFVFPGLSETVEDGFARVFRSGTTIARILRVIRSPSEGSDEEHSAFPARLTLSHSIKASELRSCEYGREEAFRRHVPRLCRKR